MKKRWTALLLMIVSGLVFSGLKFRETVPNPAAEREYRTAAGQWKPAYRREARPGLTVESLPLRKFAVMDMHEHVLGPAEAARLLAAMDRLGVARAALMGTSRYTFTLNRQWGFEFYLENNETILNLARQYPERFSAFPTLFPAAEGNLQRLEDYARRGAAGLKLYLGHGAATGKEPFHLMPLDDPRMKAVYAWCEKNRFPVMFHINLTLYYEEFIRVMEEFPRLRVCLPHFGLFKNDLPRLERLAWLLERYPGLYIDVSFGWHTFQIEGFEKLAAWPARYREFFTRHADKILFGSDMVLEPLKGDSYIDNTLRSYRQLLEMEEFRFFYRPAWPMRGLNLTDETLRKIYEDSPQRFLERRDAPAGPAPAPLAPDSPYWKSPVAPPSAAVMSVRLE